MGSSLDIKLGGAEQGGVKVKLGRAERWLLRRSVAPLAESLGYVM